MSAPRTTRRGLFGAGAAVLLTGAASPAAAVHVGATPRKKRKMTPEERKAVTDEINRMCRPPRLPNPDAELLKLLAAFDQIVTEKRAAYASCQTVAEEEAIDAQIEPLEVRQDELLDLICTTPARTVGGVQARARSLAFWHGTGWITAPDNPDEYHDKRLIAALVRDLLGKT